MYYKQNTKNIRLIILSFDDVMFDLTKLRYNYFRRLCKLYNAPFDKKTFLNDLGSCRTMFSHSPIDSALITTDAMISKIEEDLLAYSQMYGLKHRDGLVELMELFRQKKMDCIITSTHPKKYTEPLYKIAALYHRPTEIIYDDESFAPLPNPQLYKNILDQYQVAPNEVLVIAANRQTVLAANDLRMNVIYMPDLEEVTKEMEVRSLKVVHNLLEIINVILGSGQLAPLQDQYLLIRHDGSTQDLYQNYQHLRSIYREDSDTLGIIETIYQNEFSKAQKAEVEVQIQEQEEAQEEPEAEYSVLETLETALNDEEEQFISSINEALTKKKEEVKENIEFTQEDNTEIQEPLEEAKVNNPLDALNVTDDTLTLSSLEDLSPSTRPINEDLMQMIDEVSSPKQETTKEPVDRTKIFTKEELKMLGIKEKDLLNDEDEFDDDDDENTNGPSLITSFIVNIGYALINSCILCMICGVIMVGLQDWISKPENNTLYQILDAIGDTAYQLFGNFVSQLTGFFNTSEMFNGFLSVILLVSIVIYLILDIISIIKRKHPKHIEE